MKVIYRAGNITEAHIVAGMLNAHDIETHVGGHFLQGGVGELAAMDLARVYIAEEDIDKARPLIVEYEGEEKESKQPSRSVIEKPGNTPSYILPLIIISAIIATFIFIKA